MSDVTQPIQDESQVTEMAPSTVAPSTTAVAVGSGPLNLEHIRKMRKKRRLEVRTNSSPRNRIGDGGGNSAE